MYRTNNLKPVDFEHFIYSNKMSLQTLLNLVTIINDKYLIIKPEQIKHLYDSNVIMWLDFEKCAGGMKFLNYQVVIETDTQCILL